MGHDDIFKKRREERKRRKREFRQPQAKSYLIVTEGEKTEPLYFQGLADYIKDKIGGNIKVCEVPIIHINGEGYATNQLVTKAQEIVSKAKIIYENVWVIFDKDDFRDFDDAIHKAEQLGFHVGWSNQSFEYWLYLHFFYSDSGLHREVWFDKLDKIFSECGFGGGGYHKNEVHIFDILNQNGSVETAIGNAKRRMTAFYEKKQRPSEFNPGTTVHILVEELLTYLQD